MRLSVFMDLNEGGKVFALGDLVNPPHQPVSRSAVTSEEQRGARVHGGGRRPDGGSSTHTHTHTSSGRFTVTHMLVDAHSQTEQQLASHVGR